MRTASLIICVGLLLVASPAAKHTAASGLRKVLLIGPPLSGMSYSDVLASMSAEKLGTR